MFTNALNSPIGRFRVVAWLEGISYLVLLGLAMPLKYFAGIPQMVQGVGWVHGVLFIAYLVTLVAAALDRRWGFGRIIFAFIASLIPFGTFYLDRQLRQEEKSI